MKKLLLYAFGAGLALAACVPCKAADARWNGTWKLSFMQSPQDSDRLNIGNFYRETPGQGSYGGTPNGSMSYITQGLDFEFSCNGKPYPVQHPVQPASSVTCVQASDGSWTFTISANGKELSRCRHSVSTDGLLLTVACVKTNAVGSQTRSEQTYMPRTGEKAGIVGEWQKRLPATNPETITFAAQGDKMHIETSVPKTTVEANVNGDPAPVTGPRVAPGTTESVKLPSPSEMHLAVKGPGKTMHGSTFTLGNDGRTMQEFRWTTTKYGTTADQKQLIWEKQ
jgi:hypothetical protein